MLSDHVKKVLSDLKTGGLTPQNFTDALTAIVHLAQNIPDADKALIKKLAFDCLDALASRLPPPSDAIIEVLIEDARENPFKVISKVLPPYRTPRKWWFLSRTHFLPQATGFASSWTNQILAICTTVFQRP